MKFLMCSKVEWFLMSTEWSQWELIKGQRLKGHLFDQIQTLCVVHPVDGFPVYPLPVRRHKRTSWATSQHYKYTKVVLSSGFMWWNELWPGSADPPQPSHFNTRTQLCGKEETHSHIWQSASISTTARTGRETRPQFICYLSITQP